MRTHIFRKNPENLVINNLNSIFLHSSLLLEYNIRKSMYMFKSLYTCVNLLYLHMCKKISKSDFERMDELFKE
ncbi:hypothetical protein HanRHA438_Chr10g0431511 [Helianthus annuus]|nr:hypothetical protein HanRHA438_Chr10g0431511 [Helianthus annuus]